ncbi:unnamed protein product [Adineta ricciae]|uniref:Uncharacterized protein n=1 Tax=Adineta ricciae TaxID=249248 RepID=A0A814UY24_ADIRI|nr:unnamed protein product [Adineta ricciae]
MEANGCSDGRVYCSNCQGYGGFHHSASLRAEWDTRMSRWHRQSSFLLEKKISKAQRTLYWSNQQQPWSKNSPVDEFIRSLGQDEVNENIQLKQTLVKEYQEEHLKSTTGVNSGIRRLICTVFRAHFLYTADIDRKRTAAYYHEDTNVNVSLTLIHTFLYNSYSENSTWQNNLPLYRLTFAVAYRNYDRGYCTNDCTMHNRTKMHTYWNGRLASSPERFPYYVPSTWYRLSLQFVLEVRVDTRKVMPLKKRETLEVGVTEEGKFIKSYEGVVVTGVMVRKLNFDPAYLPSSWWWCKWRHWFDLHRAYYEKKIKEETKMAESNTDNDKWYTIDIGGTQFKLPVRYQNVALITQNANSVIVRAIDTVRSIVTMTFEKR